MHEVFLSPRAQKDLRQLSTKLFHQIMAEIRSLSTAPKPRGSKKLAGSVRSYRIRLGDYRILYEVDEAAKAIKIMRIRHRREAYR